MSTVTVNHIISAQIERSGLSNLDSIEIDVTGLVINSKDGMAANIVLVTFDANVQVAVSSGSFFKHSIDTSSETPWGVDQTAILLISEDPIKDTKIKLRFEPSVAVPVRWRALGISINGPISRNTLNQIIGINVMWREESPVRLPQTSGGDKSAFVGFFASRMPPPTIPESAKGSVIKKAEVIDGSDAITCYAWNVDRYDVGLPGEGPWFYAALQVRWNSITYRPPATDSDDFWALPADCEASDVLIINNNALAPVWDNPEMNVVGLPDTLLLNYVDSDGTRWIMNDMEGWWTLPPPALPDLPRPGYLDGSFPVDGRYEPRIIVLKGTFLPGPNISVAKPRLRLLRALDAVRNGALLVVKEPMGYNHELYEYDAKVKEWEQGPWPKQAWVWLSDQPKVDTVDMSGRTEFEVQLKAVDPVKYLSGARGMSKKYIDVSGSDDGRDYTTAEEWSPYRGQRYTPAPGRAYGYVDYDIVLPAVNKGTANIWPRIYISGPVSDPKVVNATTGQTMAFQGTIRSGEVLIVDCYWRTVVLRPAPVAIDDYYQSDVNGLNRRWMLKLSSPWIYMQPGSNDFRFYGNGTDAPNVAEGENPDLNDFTKTQCWLVYRSGWMGS